MHQLFADHALGGNESNRMALLRQIPGGAVMHDIDSARRWIEALKAALIGSEPASVRSGNSNVDAVRRVEA